MKLERIKNFLQTEIWRIPAKNLPRRKYISLRYLRVILLAVRQFKENKCELMAAALTFYTILSIVPVAAMAFGIAKGFGLQQNLEQALRERFPADAEMVQKVVGFANNLLQNTAGGLIAGIGVALLFWTLIRTLSFVESSFNDIWGVKEGRSFGRRVTDYLSVFLICPLLFILSSGVTVFISTQLNWLIGHLQFLGPLNKLLVLAAQVVPYFIIWALFAFLYMFMPNTKVNIRSGLLGAIVAGTLYQVVQTVYIIFQVGVSRYNAIYGSFAALPLFLIWVQLSWRIVLFGAEIAFADQNVHTYEFEQDCSNASHAYKRLLSLLIASVLVKRFITGQTPLAAAKIAETLEMPVRLVHELLFDLTQAGVVIELKQEDKDPSYHPARDINSLSIESVTAMLERRGLETLPVAQTRELQELNRSFKSFEEQIKKSPANKLLKDL